MSRSNRKSPGWLAGWGRVMLALGVITLLTLAGSAKAQMGDPEMDYGQAPPGWSADLSGNRWERDYVGQCTGRAGIDYIELDNMSPVEKGEECIYTSANLEFRTSVYLYKETFLEEPYLWGCQPAMGTTMVPQITKSEGQFLGYPAIVFNISCSHPSLSYPSVEFPGQREYWEGSYTELRRWTCIETLDDFCLTITERIFGETYLPSALGENLELPYVDALVADIDAWKARWILTLPEQESDPVVPPAQPVQPATAVPPTMVVPSKPPDPGSGGVPVAAIVVVGIVGGGVVVIVGGVLVVKIIAGVVNKPPTAPRPARTPARPPISDPEAANAIRAWQQTAQQADQEAEKYIRQWETARVTGDPNDPGYQALQKQYQDYIQYQRQQAAEARQKAQEIEAQEQQYQQEVRQQEAYRRHRRAERDFINQERRRQSQRQGAFDRQMDQLVRDNQQKMEQLKIKQKQERLRRNKDLIEARMKSDLADLNYRLSAARGYDLTVTTLEYVKAGADFAIDVYADISGTGKMLKMGYQVASGAAEGIGEGMADPDNWASHVLKGTAKGLLDVGTDKLKGGLIDGLPPQVRNHVIFSGAKMNTDPVRISMFLERTGRRAAIQRGIFNAGLEKITDKINPIVWGRDGLKGLIDKMDLSMYARSGPGSFKP